MKKYLLSIALLLLLCWAGLQYWPVTVQIHGVLPEENFSIRMPRKDKKRLEFFFREVCFVGVWSYTLLGSKPMSFDQYEKPMNIIREKISLPYLKAMLFDCFCSPNLYKICYLLNPKHLKMKLGWNALNKYVSYFPHSRFVLYTDENGSTVCLTLVDRLKLTKIVEQNLEDFQAVLHSLAMQPDALIDHEKLDGFSMLCCAHDDLIGMLLGFGKQNARLFCKYKDTCLEERPLISAWIDEESMHLEKLSQKDLTFEPWDVSDLFYPRFVCDPQSEETKQLKQTYRAEREKIIQYYAGKDIVEATLSLFNQSLYTERDSRIGFDKAGA